MGQWNSTAKGLHWHAQVNPVPLVRGHELTHVSNVLHPMFRHIFLQERGYHAYQTVKQKKARSTNQFPQGKPTQNAKSSHAQQHQSVLTHVLPFLALAVSRNDHFLWPLHNLVPVVPGGQLSDAVRQDTCFSGIADNLSQWQCDRIKSDRRETTGDPSELKQTMHSL